VAAELAPTPISIEADRFALSRVYRNLISNAIQATSPGGRVVVSTLRDGDHVRIAVADTGSGIAAERLGAIFEDFVTTKRHGLGLGLAITKRIVDQLGGTIAVESALGRGTVFTLRFPARSSDAQTADSRWPVTGDGVPPTRPLTTINREAATERPESSFEETRH
jgi:signal transduction histidine kinase